MSVKLITCNKVTGNKNQFALRAIHYKCIRYNHVLLYWIQCDIHVWENLHHFINLLFLWFVIKLKHLTDVEVTEIMDYKTFENEVYLWIQANMSIYLCLRKKLRYNKACDEFIIIFNIITPICWSKSSSPSLFVSKHIQYNKYQSLLWCRYDNVVIVFFSNWL